MEKQNSDNQHCRLSVVVPCYNEEAIIRELHKRVTKVCRQAVGNDYEFILVNDGSGDDTWRIISEIVDHDPCVVGITLSRNHGHQLALTAGLNYCTGARIFILDADLQDPPELLPEMMRMMDAGNDVVYGQRARRKGESWFKKRTAAYFYRLFNKMVDVKIPLDTGDFRLVSRRVLNVLNSFPEQQRFIRGMVGWIGFTQAPIIYERQERFAGKTKYTLKKMLKFAIDAITSFSIKPLKVASFIGVIFGFFGLLGLLYVFGGWLLGRTVVGWTSLLTAILVIGSAQMIFLGILGEYVGRLFIETKNRPLFIIDNVKTHDRSRQHKTDGHDVGMLEFIHAENGIR